MKHTAGMLRYVWSHRALRENVKATIGITAPFTLVRQPFYGKNPRQKIGLDFKLESDSHTVCLILWYVNNISKEQTTY